MDKSRLLKLDPETTFVWYLTDERFRELHKSLIEEIDWKRFRWKNALAYANRNRVLYKVCQESLRKLRNNIDENTFQALNFVVRKGNRDLKRLLKTLTVISDLWSGKIDYFIIKTRDDAPTCDADVLYMNVVDYESAIDIARASGYNFIREEPFKGWIGVEDGIKIELHHGISWFGMKALDDAFMISNPRKVKLMDILFQTINEEAEFALDLTHWILDIQPLTLDGFHRLILKAERMHAWKEIINQAEKYEWIKQLEYHLSILSKLSEYIYSSKIDLPLKHVNVRMKPCFPFVVSSHAKIPFLMKKTLRDNIGFSRLKMLQLALRRYAWTRMWL